MIQKLFDIQFRLDEVTMNEYPLVRLNECVNCELFRADLETIREKERKSAAGRKPFDTIVMSSRYWYGNPSTI